MNTDLSSVLLLANEASKTAQQLLDSLLSVRRPSGKDASLFPATFEQGDPISITASSMAMSAIHDSGDTHSQVICNAILRRQVTRNANRGAWRAQADNGYHINNAHRAMEACLRVQPTSYSKFASTFLWLQKQRPAGVKGWAHTVKNQPKAFHTANVLIALLQYVECLTLFDVETTDEKKIIDEGIEHLQSCRKAQPHGFLLWNTSSADNGICIATTILSLSVLAKYYQLFPSRDTTSNHAKIRDTLNELGAQITGDSIRDTRSLIGLGGTRLYVDLWPTFHETNPNYFHNVFTPGLVPHMLATASLVTAKSVPISKAVTGLIRWVVDNVSHVGDYHFSPLATGNTAYVWSTALALSAIAAWQKALLKPIYIECSSLILELQQQDSTRSKMRLEPREWRRDLSAQISETDAIKIVLADAKLQHNRFKVDGAADAVWADILSKLNSDHEAIRLLWSALRNNSENRVIEPLFNAALKRLSLDE